MKITVDIPESRIANLLITCAESSAITYWASQMKPAPGSSYAKRCAAETGVWYANANAIGDGFLVDVTEIEGDRGAPVTHRVNSRRLRDGLRIMAEKQGRDFGEFLSENDDMATADVFMQCVVFGEVKYG